MNVLLGAVASFVALALVFAAMERAFPARRGQPFFRAEFGIDLLFFTGQYLVFGLIFAGMLAAIDAWLNVPMLSGVRFWSQHAPVAVRAIACLMLGDLLVYWFHRACHHYDILWRFHAVHHSVERLDWLAAHREHPVDGLLTMLCMNLPALVIGLPIEVVGALAAFRGVWAIFVHSNTRLPLGPLRLLLGAPELHHWHHARVAKTAHNFANLAPWLDVLFGTYHCPPEPERYPLGLTDPWPRGYVPQLLRPFGIARWDAPTPGVPTQDPGSVSRTESMIGRRNHEGRRQGGVLPVNVLGVSALGPRVQHTPQDPEAPLVRHEPLVPEP